MHVSAVTQSVWCCALAVGLCAPPGGCEARFYPGSAFDSPAGADLSRPPALDGGTLVDLAGVDLAGTDLSTQPSDAGATVGSAIVATGTFGGRAGHQGSGHATLERDATGAESIALDSDFVVSGVPGPVVVLTSRSSIGTGITGADLDLGVLKANSGAGRYPIAAGSGGRRNLFIYCKPFGVEVALAPLVDQP